MRVLIYGGRDFVQTQDSLDFLIDWWRLHILAGTPWDVVISGKARGGDAAGEDFAERMRIAVEEYPADWKTHGKAAGFIRNQQMLDSGIDLAIQFPGGNGTRDMRRRLDKAGVRVIEYA